PSSSKRAIARDNAVIRQNVIDRDARDTSESEEHSARWRSGRLDMPLGRARAGAHTGRMWRVGRKLAGDLDGYGKPNPRHRPAEYAYALARRRPTDSQGCLHWNSGRWCAPRRRGLEQYPGYWLRDGATYLRLRADAQS